ncbi:hypothetical protein EIP91_001820 [Steccherinum ochraceum]|uniref:Arrestin-like N-terminal domain-containing protein n=1 Tax=Steccherinum ochraceum TaxID=92696 RepID=A0A4R0RXL2_9APHY|nr:hypothetical protein EIP91_001820 [Steccherinum ochraceum]
MAIDVPSYSSEASSSLLTLPSYSPSTDAPRYSPEPHDDEHRLVFVARKQPDSNPTSSFVKKSGNVTVLLSGQESGAALPCYTRHGIVQGEILLEEEATVLSVEIKLEGRQTVTVVDGGLELVQLFDLSQTVWSKRGENASSSPCAAVLPFSIPFPRGYNDGRGLKPLPPTFDAQFPGAPGIYVECKYSFTVTVSKSGLGGWKRQKIVSTPPFLSTVKSAPGDWHQVISTMKTSEASPLEPLECHLFIPSVQIYAISDTVPFHLQLRGSPASLLAFLSGPTPSSPKLPKGLKALGSSLKNRSPRTSSEGTRQPLFDTATPQTMPFNYNASSVRVYILRQVCVRVNGQKTWRDILLGEGKLWPLHSQTPSLRPNGADGEHSVDWEGEVRCGSDVAVGSFSSGDLVVKDFIVLDLQPPSTQTALKHHQHAHPIRLVTDSYAES